MRKIIGKSTSFIDPVVVHLWIVTFFLKEHIIISLLIMISFFKSLKTCLQRWNCEHMYPNSHCGQRDSTIVQATICGTWRHSKRPQNHERFHRYAKILPSVHNLEANKPKFLFKFWGKTNISSQSIKWGLKSFYKKLNIRYATLTADG